MKRRNFIKSALAFAALASPIAALAVKASTTKKSKRSVVYYEEVGDYRPVPVGYIEMFAGDNVPEGWATCDGTNGTPDLRARFMYSKSIYAPKDEKPKLEYQFIMKIK